MAGSFAKTSYKLHKDHFDEYASSPKKKRFSLSWLQDDTVDAWRHRRMRQLVEPLLSVFTKARWLTVGDGRYGSDAHFLREAGARVMATDISDKLLKEGKKNGYIDNYQRENAEELTFADNSFDFVFCKEAYHHFPRPMIALYEMLRVAKKGVVLIEPQDTPNIWQTRLMQWLRQSKPSPITGYFNSFEVSGNYVYKLSKREIEKVALGLQLDTLAFAGLDDYYILGVEHLKLDHLSVQLVKTRLILLALEIGYRLGIRQRSILVAVILKAQPSKRLRLALTKRGFELHDLPHNPYLTRK